MPSRPSACCEGLILHCKSTASGRSSAEKRLLQAFLLLLALLLRIVLVPIQSSDYTLYVHQWLAYIHAHCGYKALADGFSNYEPAYTYLLVAISYCRSTISDLLLIKVLCFPFEFLAAWAGMDIVRIVRRADMRATVTKDSMVFPVLLLLPTVVLNNAAWGQCDVIYTAFLLLSFRSVLLGRRRATILWFGVALSFKFQALFFAPFIVVLVLKRRISAGLLLFVPTVPAAFALPAVLAGRPAIQIVRIFLDQAHTYNRLAMNVANLWEFIPGNLYSIGVIVAYLSAAAGMFIYLRYAAKQKTITASWLLLTATVSLTFVPYMLPKMHDRYFFTAEVFCVLLGCATPRFRVPALFMQTASLLMYANFLCDLTRRPKLHAAFTIVAVIANTYAFLYLCRAYLATTIHLNTVAEGGDVLPMRSQLLRSGV
jgi:Gpi18-like mannosyltransferase